MNTLIDLPKAFFIHEVISLIIIDYRILLVIKLNRILINYYFTLVFIQLF